MFVFYDLRIKPLNIIPDGERVDFDFIINEFKKNNTEYFDNYPNFISNNFNYNDLDVVQCEKKEWKVFFSTMIFIITGHVVNLNDRKILQKKFYELKRNLINKDNKHTELFKDRSFVFGLIPYLFSGFILDTKRYNYNSINSISSAVLIIEHLISEKEIHVSTLLCAHRESKHIDRGKLVDDIDLVGCRKMINLVCGIKDNLNISRDKKIIWDFYHTESDINSILSLFPNVILRYLNDLNFTGLVLTLKKHFNDFRKILDKYTKDRGLIFNLYNAGELYTIIEARKKSLSEVEVEKIKFIAINDAILDIIRVVKNYEEVQKISSEIIDRNIFEINKEDSGLAELLSKIIKYYKESGDVVSKAILETSFYYEFGKQSLENKSIVLGFERDHDLFQAKAIALGYDSGIDVTKSDFIYPALYARRHRPEIDSGGVNTLSFRQFWRPADRNPEIKEEKIKRIKNSNLI